MAASNEINPSAMEKWQHRAMSLIEGQKTLVLATSDDHRPWAAPVYYVYAKSTFYFFSSPRSKHIEHALKNNQTAAAIFSDGDRWEQLEGLQMAGPMELVRNKLERLSVTALYFKKFPFSRKLLSGIDMGGMDLSSKVSLYAFTPDDIHYTNNSMGFGSRMKLSLKRSGRI